jgi:hypothetical protein
VRVVRSAQPLVASSAANRCEDCRPVRLSAGQRDESGQGFEVHQQPRTATGAEADQAGVGGGGAGVRFVCRDVGQADSPERVAPAGLPRRRGLLCRLSELEVELAVGEPGGVDGRQAAGFRGQSGRQSPQGTVEIADGLRVGVDEQRILGIGGGTRRLH